ncbi:addiction module protein [bacterium]|nr:addiction module protein [bacterium]
MKTSVLSKIQELSVSERIRLVEEIWDSIAANPESVPVTNARKKELDRRLKALKQSPREVSTWSDLKKRVRTKR